MVRGRVILALLLFPALTAAERMNATLDAELGRALFERSWVSAPSSTQANDGLGPLFDASSCQGCHVPAPPTPALEDAIAPGTIVRLGNAQGEGDPVYGRQLQTRSVQQQYAEGTPDISYRLKGNLRETALTLHRLGYGPLAADTNMALRRPLKIDGIGLLARVPDDEILSRVAENEDGISGRAAWLTYADGMKRLGRFGWKATEPDLNAQIETAFSRDLGMSTRRHPDPSGECTETQTHCREAPQGADRGEVEISDDIRDLIADFLNAAPAPQPVTANTQGERIFAGIGCASCHATLHLGDGTPVPAYSDLLLHDMGEDLNDGIREGAAAPGEWRTVPLWGLSATLQLGGLLHDGRARNVEEAVEWHGGEAEGARTRFRELSSGDKAALLAFVNGL